MHVFAESSFDRLHIFAESSFDRLHVLAEPLLHRVHVGPHLSQSCEYQRSQGDSHGKHRPEHRQELRRPSGAVRSARVRARHRDLLVRPIDGERGASSDPPGHRYYTPHRVNRAMGNGDGRRTTNYAPAGKGIRDR